MYGVAKDSAKPDFNAATPTASLAEFLTQRDPLLLTTNAGDDTRNSQKLLAYRDRDKNGVITKLRRTLRGRRRQLRRAVSR